MGYLKIQNLYKDTQILEFKQVYALEKIHGTSSHLKWKDGALTFFSGGAKHDTFVDIFKDMDLFTKFSNLGIAAFTIFGEAYGGKMQGMKETYGAELRFVAFDVQIGDSWLSVPQAEAFVLELSLEFVDYELVSTDLEDLNFERDRDSVQAIRNGCGEGKKREGVVLRPPFEVTLNNGKRLITKHKSDAFKETRTPRKVGVDQQVLADAQAVADEWVTPMRLSHVLDKITEATGIEHTGIVIKAMTEDVLLEGEGEIVDSKAVRKALSKATAVLYKKRISKLY